MRHKFPGFFVTLLIGGAVLFLCRRVTFMDPLVLGIVLGMAVRTCFGSRPAFEPGFRVAPALFIPVGIIFYGVNLRFDKMGVVPLAAWLQIIIGIILIFWLGSYLGSRLDLPAPFVALINVGTAICGASAIALATPVVKARSEETGLSLILITLWGSLGMLFYPFLQEALLMTQENYALLCATTLHQTGMVKTAAAALGKVCVEQAMVIKVARTVMIIPVLAALSWFASRSSDEVPAKAVFPIPWFLWAFVGTGILFSFFPFLQKVSEPFKAMSTVLWTMSLTGLGLTVDLRRVARHLRGPVLMSLGVWAIIIVNYFIGYFGMGY